MFATRIYLGNSLHTPPCNSFYAMHYKTGFVYVTREEKLTLCTTMLRIRDAGSERVNGIHFPSESSSYREEGDGIAKFLTRNNSFRADLTRAWPHLLLLLLRFTNRSLEPSAKFNTTDSLEKDTLSISARGTEPASPRIYRLKNPVPRKSRSYVLGKLEHSLARRVIIAHARRHAGVPFSSWYSDSRAKERSI